MSRSACTRLQALLLGGAPGWSIAGAAVSFKAKVPPFSTHSRAVSIRGVGLPPAHVPHCCKFKRCAISSGVACNRPRPATPEYVICTGKQQQPAELAAISGSQRLGWCGRRPAPPPPTPGTRHRQRAVRVSATACRKAQEASITQRKARVCIHCHCPGRGARLGCSRPRIRRKHRRATAWSTQYVHASGRAGLSMAHAVSPARHRAQVRRRPSAGWTRPLRSAGVKAQGAQAGLALCAQAAWQVCAQQQQAAAQGSCGRLCPERSVGG